VWTATFSNPPMNFLTPQSTIELYGLLDAAEADPDARVLVVQSAHADFFLGRYDLAQAGGADPLAALAEFTDLTSRLEQSPIVSIAKIRGRARGGGAELALACDMRFASLERAILAQPEVPAALLPGGGALERLPPLIGRARALEVVLGGDDIDASTAAAYGWVNRAVPDNELDEHVNTLARRIASFDPAAVASAKQLINRHTTQAADDLRASHRELLSVALTPGAAARRAELQTRARDLGPSFELDLGRHLGIPNTL
jgi:enoyl-CoA hydratase/carnithine racemase